MNYTLVDKNLFIPEISNSIDFFDIIIQLYKKVYRRDNEYCSNVYIIKKNNTNYESIIQFENNCFFQTINNIKNKIDVDLNLIFIEKNQNKTTVTIVTNEITKKIINNEELVKMEIVFNDTTNTNSNNNNIKIEEVVESQEDKKIREEKDKKKELLLKTCEQVMDLYNLELSNIKKTENKIKTLNAKLEKLANKKREKIIKDISRTKGDYDTWKKLKYKINRDDSDTLVKPIEELELRSDQIIPILFTAKYNYIDNAIKNENIKKIFETLNKLSIDELYIQEQINLNVNVIKFCDKYYEISKKDLHYKFDHDWDYLDSEMNADSKSGTLSMFE
jgi:hypothetical protein